MSTNENMMPGGSDCLIKFGSRSDYNRFVGQLRSQLRSYLITSCQENSIQIGSPDFLTLESILMDVFMKYTLEFIRENLLVDRRPLTPPPEFSDSPRPVNGHASGDQQSSHHARSASSRAKEPIKPTLTRPCDTALNERVIRQQYALYDAAVENTRKRKDLPGHILQRLEAAAQQATEDLHTHAEEINQLEATRADQAADPRQRWDLLNAEPPNIQETQENFTGANQTICKLVQSLPQMIQTASRAITLHDEVTNSLKTG